MCQIFFKLHILIHKRRKNNDLVWVTFNWGEREAKHNDDIFYPPTYQLPNKFLFSQVFAFVDGKHHHLMEENIWLNVKKKLRQNIDSHDVTSFFPFSPHMFPQNWLLFSRHMFPQNWLLFSCHMFHQNWLLQMLSFWVLSILCFVVKNYLRQKIYFRFFSEIQSAASDVTFFFSFFASYVSSQTAG